MMKSVLISVNPQWCAEICHRIGWIGNAPLYKKRVEVRKTRPKIVEHFKVYIYCTKNGKSLIKDDISTTISFIAKNGGKVIGEFVCRVIGYWNYALHDNDTISLEKLSELSCVSEDDLLKYADGGCLYGWHISDLKIYDKPRELSEFKYHCKYEFDDDFRHCDGCGYHHFSNTPSSGREEWCGCDGIKRITRPPQSWCYVEEQG